MHGALARSFTQQGLNKVNNFYLTLILDRTPPPLLHGRGRGGESDELEANRPAAGLHQDMIHSSAALALSLLCLAMPCLCLSL